MDNNKAIDFLTEPKFEVFPDPIPAQKSVSNSGINGFTSLIYKLLKIVMPEVTFTSAWPQGTEVKERLPAITYKVVNREPAKAIKPILRETLPDEDFPGQHVEIYGQTFDVVMEFSIWSERSYESDGLGCVRDPASCPLLADNTSGLCSEEFKPEVCPYSIDGILERFEDFMVEYAGVFFEKAGVQQLHLVTQEEDNKESTINPPLMKRTLRYFMKVEKIRVFKTADLQEVNIKVDIPD